MMNRSQKGFTIVELLVVIVVIGVIAAVVLALFSAPKANSRDARREQDMKEIQGALNLYINHTGTYPICSLGAVNAASDCLSSALKDSGQMTTVPRDPVSSGSCSGLPDSPDPNAFQYCYASDDNGTIYWLFYHLETNTIKPTAWYTLNP